MLKTVETGNMSRESACPSRTPAKSGSAVETIPIQSVFHAYRRKRVSWNSILQCSSVRSRNQEREMRRL